MLGLRPPGGAPWVRRDDTPNADLGIRDPVGPLESQREQKKRRTEKRPFESWAELEALVGKLGPRYGHSCFSRLACGRGSGSRWRSR
jgi:hypothetical protein